jgi:hypothetical protein
MAQRSTASAPSAGAGESYSDIILRLAVAQARLNALENRFKA